MIKDYPMHYTRLIPEIAFAYSLHFVAMRLMSSFDRLSEILRRATDNLSPESMLLLADVCAKSYRLLFFFFFFFLCINADFVD